MSSMKTITCGICGHGHRLYGTQIERKLMNPGRNSCLLYKCKMCSSTLNIIRINNEWKNRWIENPNMELESPIRKEDL